MAKPKPKPKAKSAAAPPPAKPRPAKAPDPKPSAPVPSPYSKSELKEFRQLLEALRRRLSGDVERLEEAGFRKQQDGGDLSSMPLHMADQGTDSFEQDVTLGLMETEADELQEVEEALERIRDNTYGACESCGKPVPKARLRAIPYTRFCVPCKTKEEGA